MRRRLVEESSLNNGSIPPSEAVAGDICLYDKDQDELIIVPGDGFSGKIYPSSNYSPVGVVAIPGSHDVYGTGQCAIVSIVPMSNISPDKGSESGVTLRVGSSDSTRLKSFNYIANIGKAEAPKTTIQGENLFGYFPSDIFTTNPNPEDNKVYYTQLSTTSSYAIPSPYKSDGSFNSIYKQTKSPTSTANCLSDFDGIGNTNTYLSLATAQSDWKTAGTISNTSGSGYYPAPCCCWRYHTPGTKQGDWYLPSMGELGYMMVRLKAINESINALKSSYNTGAPIDIDGTSGYWASTQLSTTNNWSIKTNEGVTQYNQVRGATKYIRAYLRI